MSLFDYINYKKAQSSAAANNSTVKADTQKEKEEGYAPKQDPELAGMMPDMGLDVDVEQEEEASEMPPPMFEENPLYDASGPKEAEPEEKASPIEKMKAFSLKLRTNKTAKLHEKASDDEGGFGSKMAKKKLDYLQYKNYQKEKKHRKGYTYEQKDARGKKLNKRLGLGTKMYNQLPHVKKKLDEQKQEQEARFAEKRLANVKRMRDEIIGGDQ